mgnify:CR=1 FL=1
MIAAKKFGVTPTNKLEANVVFLIKYLKGLVVINQIKIKILAQFIKYLSLTVLKYFFKIGTVIPYFLVGVYLKFLLTFEACRRAGIVAVSARQLKPIEKLKLKLTTKSQIEFGQARY